MKPKFKVGSYITEKDTKRFPNKIIYEVLEYNNEVYWIKRFGITRFSYFKFSSSYAHHIFISADGIRKQNKLKEEVRSWLR